MWAEGHLPSQSLYIGGTLSKLPLFFCKLKELFSWKSEGRVCEFLSCSVSPLLPWANGFQLASLEEVKGRLVLATLCAVFQIYFPSFSSMTSKIVGTRLRGCGVPRAKALEAGAHVSLSCL